MQAFIVLTTMPNVETARALAEKVVAERLAACVNILSPCQSIFRWQGALDRADEVPLLIKTTADRYAALENCIRSGHPYELPEIVAVPISHGLPDYLAWLAAETTPLTP